MTGFKIQLILQEPSDGAPVVTNNLRKISPEFILGPAEGVEMTDFAPLALFAV